jgi:NAD(P)-dependent dehydrogenase (short-subunit alcohol dehydrogenase family)
MGDQGTIVVIRGTSEIGKAVAARYAARGHPVVVTSRDPARAAAAAAAIGHGCLGLPVELCRPHEIARELAGVSGVQHLVLVAVDRDENRVRDYNIDGALMLVTLKLVGYTAVVHTLAPRMRPDGSIVLFGGLARDRPYAGSTTVTTVNGGVTAMVHTLAVELAPLRVNALYPGVVGDSPYWANKPPEVLEQLCARTPIGRLVTIADVVDATGFLLENRGVNGVNLILDGGWQPNRATTSSTSPASTCRRFRPAKSQRPSKQPVRRGTPGARLAVRAVRCRTLPKRRRQCQTHVQLP